MRWWDSCSNVRVFDVVSYSFFYGPYVSLNFWDISATVSGIDGNP